MAPTAQVPVEYLVRLVVPHDRSAAGRMQHALLPHLEWLKQLFREGAFLVYNHSGGTLVVACRGGNLRLTHPDGSESWDVGTDYVVDKATAGTWKVQVLVTGGEGEQYAIAIGQAGYSTYLPIIMHNAGP